MTYDEIHKSVLDLPSLGLATLRNQITHELHRRMNGSPHPPTDWKMNADEKTKAAQALSRGDLERGAVEMVSADQNASDAAMLAKNGTSQIDLPTAPQVVPDSA